MIDLHHRFANWMIALAVYLPKKDGINGLCEPLGTEVEAVHAREEEAHRRWSQRNRQQCRDCHGEVLSERERLEETAFLSFQAEDRKKANRDDEQREKARPSNLLHGGNPNSMRWTGPAFRFPKFELLMCLLDHNYGCVDQCADGYGKAAKGHDVCRHPHPLHRDEG